MTTLHEGDCARGDVPVLPTLAADSFDSCVTDPPYEIGFMGNGWDKSGVAFDPATWVAVLRVLKPGAYLLAFGGTRTFHRLTCAIEDAGFELRDCLMWLYGTGFPKGAGCLKPGYEPIVLARKPGKRVLPLGIEGCRIGIGQGGSRDGEATAHKVYTNGIGAGKKFTMKPGPRGGNAAGRYPANVCHDGSDEVLAAFAEFGESAPSFRPQKGDGIGKGYGGSDAAHNTARGYSDTGTAARFFYAAKASRAEREGNPHPTVKPLALMQWLVRLVTPPGGRVVDPFAGSGTTLLAAEAEGRDSVGIESDAGHCAIIRKRLEAAKATQGLFAEAG